MGDAVTTVVILYCQRLIRLYRITFVEQGHGETETETLSDNINPCYMVEVNGRALHLSSDMTSQKRLFSILIDFLFIQILTVCERSGL